MMKWLLGRSGNVTPKAGSTAQPFPLYTTTSVALMLSPPHGVLLHEVSGLKVREVLMVSEVPIFEFEAQHMTQVRAFKHNAIWEERGLEQALGLIQVLENFGLPFSRGGHR